MAAAAAAAAAYPSLAGSHPSQFFSQVGWIQFSIVLKLVAHSLVIYIDVLYLVTILYEIILSLIIDVTLFLNSHKTIIITN